MTEFAALPYQAGGIRFLLAHPFSGLIMRPGLGKTACAEAAFVILRKRRLARRALVVAPLAVAQLVWKAEAAKWEFPIAIGFAHGAKFEETISDRSLDLVTMTPEGWVRLRQTYTVRDVRKLFDWLIVDESTKFKHVGSVRSTAQREYLEAFSRRTILTGTPAPNGYMDLFGQVFILDRGRRLGQWVTQYAREYFDDLGLGSGRQVLKEGAAERIHKRLGDCLYFVDDEALGLPPYRENPVYVELGEKVMAKYREFKKEAVAELEGQTVVAVNAAVLSNKLRQVANGDVYAAKRIDGASGPAVHIHDAKTQAVLDLVEQMQGNPIMVAYEFDSSREVLLRALGEDTPCIKGGMSKRRRAEILGEFDTGRTPVLLVQVTTVSHGLNLQAHCHNICVHSIPWDWEVLEQFIKRVHRLGQKKHVIVHFLIGRGTVDEVVMRALKQKDKTQRGLLRALVQYLKESGDDWRDAEPVADDGGGRRARRAAGEGGPAGGRVRAAAGRARGGAGRAQHARRRGRVPREVRPADGGVERRKAAPGAAKPRRVRLPPAVPARGAARVHDRPPARRPGRRGGRAR